MKVIVCLLAVATVVCAHGGQWTQRGGGGNGYSFSKPQGDAGWNLNSNGATQTGGWNDQSGISAAQSYGGGYAGAYAGNNDDQQQAAYKPPIVSYVSRKGDSTSFSIGQQGLVKPAVAPVSSSSQSIGGLYGQTKNLGELYGWGEAPESNFDYSVKHPPTTYGSSYGWDTQSGDAAAAAGWDASSFGIDAAVTSYGHSPSGPPSALYAAPAAGRSAARPSSIYASPAVGRSATRPSALYAVPAVNKASARPSALYAAPAVSRALAPPSALLNAPAVNGWRA